MVVKRLDRGRVPLYAVNGYARGKAPSPSPSGRTAVPGARRLLYLAANVMGGVVLVLLLLDPGRDLLPVGILLALAVFLAVLPRFLPPGR